MSSSKCAAIDDSLGPYASGCRGGFDLTQLFEEVTLVIPCVTLLLLIAPFRVFYLLRKGAIKVDGAYLLWCKLAVYTCLISLSLANLVLWTQVSAVPTKASVPTAILSLIGSSVLPLLSYFEHVYSCRPSTTINLFLLFTTLFDAARARTLWLQPYHQDIAIVAVTSVSIKILSLALEATQKRRYLRSAYRSLPPEDTSGILSRWVFAWQIPLFTVGYKATLGIEDLFTLDKHLKSLYLHKLLQSRWSPAATKSDYALLIAVCKSLKGPILSIVFPRLCFIAFTFAQPFLITATLNWSERDPSSDDKNQGYGLIGAWFLVYIGIGVTMGQHQHLTFRAIAMARGQLISMLFEKATELSITNANPTAALTLMSADIERIDMGWRTAHEIWANLVEIAIAIYLLERQLGIACVIPVGTALVSLLGSIIAVSFVMARQALWLEAIEKRVSVTSQMLGSMKGVKMCGLTDVLKSRIQTMRNNELHISGKFRRLLIWNMGLAYFAPILAPIFTFTAYSLLARNQGDGGTLDTNRVFTSLSLFALLQEPLTSFVTSLSSFMGSIGCFTRIQAFLDSDVRHDCRIIEAAPSGSDSRSTESASSENQDEKASLPSFPMNEPSMMRNRAMEGEASCVLIKDAAFGYDAEKPPTLENINAEIPRGKLTLVVGPVGSGKSTLLKAILGEVRLLKGSLVISEPEVGYCDQAPWHMNGTVRQSIIAFSPLDEVWYQKVLEACALSQDLEQLPKRDLTSIGSKGIVLSGGQSQRVSLARAIYARKPAIILDDVFSGLDAHTEDTIFHGLLGREGILRQFNTTVIMASSRSNRLPYADHIISLEGKGTGCDQGTFESLKESRGYVSQFLTEEAHWDRDQHSDSQTAPDPSPKPEESSLEEEKVEAGRRTGDMAIYTYYVRAIGWIPTFLFVFAICAFIFCQSFPTIWLNWWAAANEKEPYQRLGYYLGIYGMLGALALILLVVSCWQMIVTMVPLSGKNFHSSLLNTVLNAPMSFFAATDAGVTINRFSQDLQLIDMDLPLAALNTFATFVLCIAQLALVAVGSAYTAIAFPFLFAALWLVQHVYLRTSRQLRFMDLEAKSPLYALFTESVAGLATLRAFGWSTALKDRLYELLDRSQRPFYLLYAVQRWLTLVLDMFVAGIAVLLIIIVTQLRGMLPPGLVGVALVNVILFSQNLKLLLMFWTNLETHIGAIARIKSFTTYTTSEHEPQEDQPPPSTWPSRGTISFEHVSAGYKPSENVLKDVSITIQPGQKVGICGRTGSGKSSMISCLFRMIDLHDGRITIDGLDISTLPREQVRTRLVGVPQDAFLIEGSSVQLNADPSESLSEAAVEDALKAVELWGIVCANGGLDVPIEALHLSQGQKQLFCIARAILRPSPVVVFDEATSSVDSHTDALIQRVMKERFADRTVLSVVHKLESALDDFDIVLVLDAGELKEFGHPRKLHAIGPEGSVFAGLYERLTSKKNDHHDEDERRLPTEAADHSLVSETILDAITTSTGV